MEFPKKGSCSWFCSGGNYSSSCGSVQVHLNCLSGSLGASWQEATELIKALEMLLENALNKNVAVKRALERKLQGQDAVAVAPSLDSENRPEVEGQVRSVVGPSLTFLLVFTLVHFFNSWALLIAQDHELPQQCELFTEKDAFFSFPGHEEQGKESGFVVGAMGTFQRSQ